MRQTLATLTLLLPLAAHAQDTASEPDTTVRGQCTEESHLASGPIGSDLRRTRFACNVAVLSFGDDRVLVQFTTGKAGDKPTLGFAGPVVKGEDDVVVDTIYFEPKQAVRASRGSQCELTVKDDSIAKIYCGATADGSDGQRRAMVVSFTATH